MKNLVTESLNEFNEIIKPINDLHKLDSRTRRIVNKELSKLPTYNNCIPVEEINDVLKKNGLLLLQEDGTPYEGIFCGEEGYSNLEIGYLNSENKINDIKFYTPIRNSSLVLTWYKMRPGRYEIVTYLS